MFQWLLMLLVIVLSANLRAAEHPQWSQLAPLLGTSIESDELKAFAKQYKLRHYNKFDEGGFHPADQAYTLMYRKNRIETIVLQASPWPKSYGEPHWRPFSQPLPGGLKATDSQRGIVAKLGPPLKDQENRWRIEDLVVWVHFDDDGKAIAELFIKSRPGK